MTTTSARRAPSGSVSGRARDFRLYWVAGGVNLLGSQASGLVLPLVALAVSGSPAAAGLVGGLGLTGRLVTAPVAGVLADRLPRKAMMVTALLVAAAAMTVVAGVLAAGAATFGVLAGAAFVQGVAQAGYESAGAGAIRRVLPADDQRALARLEARNHAMQIAGPMIGGSLYQLARWAPFLADVVSYVVAAACVAAIRTDLSPQRAERPSFLADLRTGLRFVWTHPFLRFVTFWAAGVNFVFGALIYHTILVTGRRGDLPVSIGLILAIASVGGLVGALAAPKVLQRVRPVVAIPVASWVTVGLVAALPVARQPWSYGLLFGLVFLLTPMVAIVFQARAITVTPDHLQGRVATVIGTTGEALRVLAPVLAGVLVARYAPGVAALIFALLLAVLAAYATANVRKLRATVPAVEED
ncbi:MFS transporter [Micromonospora cathayae]|uniref:MFS transporter n=1 Tax=Micromonospora cathayae TaxID=3028804 RepID=A0ABY7ZLD3_9ACTN|nr:MFS transporter [Micromonospora sp. HUAS 3]WDZ82719.1 MFS transporter [Micromonospora sp. HUAS 3]